EDAAADGRLPAARFANKAERFTSANAEAHAVHRLDCFVPPPEKSRARSEVLLQISDFKNVSVVIGHVIRSERIANFEFRIANCEFRIAEPPPRSLGIQGLISQIRNS